MRNLPEYVSEEDIGAMFSVADTDGDGVIDFKEFRVMLAPTLKSEDDKEKKKKAYDIEELRSFMYQRAGDAFKWFSGDSPPAASKAPGPGSGQGRKRRRSAHHTMDQANGRNLGIETRDKLRVLIELLLWVFFKVLNSPPPPCRGATGILSYFNTPPSACFKT